MARNVLVSDLVTQIRQRADVQNTQFVTDTELIAWINNSNTALYDAIVSKYNDYFVSSDTFQLVPGTDAYALPATTYKVLGVEQSIDSGPDRWLTMLPYNFNERNRRYNTAFNMSLYPTYKYHIQGNNVVFKPAPTGTATIRIWFVPAPPVIASGSDSINGFSGWEEYIINDCAAKVKAKQELDPNFYLAQKQEMLQRILTMAQNYDAGPAKRVTDIYTMNDDVLFPLLSL